MAIVKLSSSGKALLFFDDFGNVYSTSKKYLLGHVSGRQKAPFVELSRLPMPVSDKRFRLSPLLGKGYEEINPDSEDWYPPQCPHRSNMPDERVSQDALSPKQKKKKEMKETFSDEDIDF